MVNTLQSETFQKPLMNQNQQRRYSRFEFHLRLGNSVHPSVVCPTPCKMPKMRRGSCPTQSLYLKLDYDFIFLVSAKIMHVLRHQRSVDCCQFLRPCCTLHAARGTPQTRSGGCLERVRNGPDRQSISAVDIFLTVQAHRGHFEHRRPIGLI